MATEYSRIIYNITRMPSAKAFLVSFPMYMYRMQTKKFAYGLDFFQRCVLKFKAKPGVTNSQIAAFLGLELDLVDSIEGVLRHNDLVDINGMLTTNGEVKLKELDSLVVDSSHEELGYVFQYVDREGYLPYYVKDLGQAPNLTSNNEIIVGTKGEGEDKTRRPVELSFITDKKRVLPFPREEVVFDLISRSTRWFNNDKTLSIHQLKRDLSLCPLHDTPDPIPVLICTYIYLPKCEGEEYYEPEWQIQDPFTGKPSANLKFYLESFNEPKLKIEIERHFANVDTMAKKSFGDYSDYIEKEVEKLRQDDFGMEFKMLDRNLQQYLTSAIKNIFLFRQYGYRDIDSSEAFVISAQKALENIFLTDKESRPDIYEDMYTENDIPPRVDPRPYYKDRQDVIGRFIREKHIQMADSSKLFGLAKKVDPRGAHSLKHYVYCLILTYTIDDTSPLFGLIANRLDDIFELADCRNKKGHGRTQAEGRIFMITQEQAEKYYALLRDFVNEYMTVAL